MKRTILSLSVLAVLTSAQTLTTFEPGKPAKSSEMNANFKLLMDKISALEAKQKALENLRSSDSLRITELEQYKTPMISYRWNVGEVHSINTMSTISFGQKIYAPNNYYSGGTFTAPQEGSYYLHFSLYSQAQAPDWAAAFFKNGQLIQTGKTFGTVSWGTHIECNGAVRLEKGDRLQVKTYAVPSASGVIQADDVNGGSNLSIVRIGN